MVVVAEVGPAITVARPVIFPEIAPHQGNKAAEEEAAAEAEGAVTTAATTDTCPETARVQENRATTVVVAAADVSVIIVINPAICLVIVPRPRGIVGSVTEAAAVAAAEVVTIAAKEVTYQEIARRPENRAPVAVAEPVVVVHEERKLKCAPWRSFPMLPYLYPSLSFQSAVI